METTEIIKDFNRVKKSLLLLEACGWKAEGNAYDHPVFSSLYEDYNTALMVIHDLMKTERIITDTEVRSRLWNHRISYADVSLIAREAIDLNFVLSYYKDLHKAIEAILDKMLWVVIECGLVKP